MNAERTTIQCPYCYEDMKLDNFKLESWECATGWEELNLIGVCPKCGRKSLLWFRGSEINSEIYHFDEGVAY